MKKDFEGLPAKLVYLIFVLFIFTSAKGQSDTCIFPAIKHRIESIYSDVDREYWVSLPMRYDTLKTYPVLYVFDAEWRFNLVRHIAYDMAGNNKIPHHIVVGIPHINWENQRGKDLTFSQSKNEYDGEDAEDNAYNSSNSGGGSQYYGYLTKELIPDVDKHYATSHERVLIGHSYGGYFASYILPTDSFFTAYQIYDPSIWFSEGEVIRHFTENSAQLDSAHVFISLQPIPAYHKNKIYEWIDVLQENSMLEVAYTEYPNETHNSLYMQSFIDGIKSLYSDFKGE